MNSTEGRNGFTLVEILVTLALIASILSMVFGSYFATSKSARAYRAGIATCRQGQTTLDHLARRLRCAYAGTDKDAGPGEFGTQQKIEVRKEGIDYFSGGRNAPNGEILHFVTTNGFSEAGEKPTKGLFEVTYRFDRRRGTLFLSQRRLIGKRTGVERENWKPIAENIELVKLEFFDGRQWLLSWDFEDKKTLPSAVRMEIRWRDEHDRRYDYSTAALIPCHGNGAKTNTEAIVSANKR